MHLPPLSRRSYTEGTLDRKLGLADYGAGHRPDRERFGRHQREDKQHSGRDANHAPSRTPSSSGGAQDFGAPLVLAAR